MSAPPVACKKHRHTPVKGYSPCAGCEVERLIKERDAALAELAALKGEQVPVDPSAMLDLRVAAKKASPWSDKAERTGAFVAGAVWHAQQPAPRTPEGPKPQASRAALSPAEQPAFVTQVTQKLRRTFDCFEDNQGTDIGRDWLSTLVQLGLIDRVQRSPALWEITDQGFALLASAQPQGGEA